MLLKKRQAQQIPVATQRLLIFPVGALIFALRLAGVQKIVPLPTIFKSGDRTLGITHWQDQEVMVIDLHQQIYQRPAQSTQPKPRFLIVVEVEAVETEFSGFDDRFQHRRADAPSSTILYGMIAEGLPMLKAVPETEIHAIPMDYRDRDPLGIADALIQVSLDVTSTDRHKSDRAEIATAFLLDPTRLLELVNPMSVAG
jgi:chemotaxis signal transduction protein